MKIKLIVIGKLKEKYLREGCEEYIKRLSKFCNLKIIELDEFKLSDKPSQKEIDNALSNEGKNISKHCEGYVISMCIEGNQINSEKLAEKIETIGINGYNTITFIIGSSFGLDSSIKNQSNFKLSISKMTFTHQIARMLLLEQIYRAFQINTNGKYHK